MYMLGSNMPKLGFQFWPFEMGQTDLGLSNYTYLSYLELLISLAELFYVCVIWIEGPSERAGSLQYRLYVTLKNRT